MKNFTILLFLIISLLSANAFALPLDKIVAAVSDEAITLSELHFEYFLLNPDKEFPANINTLGIRTLIEQIIQRKLVLKDAERLSLVDISDKDVASEFVNFKKRFGISEKYELFLKKTGFSDNYVKGRVREKLIISSFLEKRVAITAFVRTDEVEGYFRENFQMYKGKQLKDAAEEIREKLFALKFQTRLEEYIHELKQRYPVIIIGDDGK